MTTFSDLVNDVLLLMEGYGLDQDRAAFLTGGIDTNTLTATVDSTANLSAGIAEIGDELVYIKSVDDNSNSVTFAPDGRGYRGTVAATHATNARVTMTPTLPRSLVKRKINETIVGVYPTLWGVATSTIAWNPVKVGYAVPADVQEILQVTYQETGPSQAWLPVRRWSIDLNPDSVEFPTGKVLNIYESLYAAQNVRLVYQKRPTELSADTDDLATSGLSASARSVIVAGTAWRLVSFMDASRLKVNTAVVDQLDERNPIGTATQIGSYLRKQYERELMDEQQRQQLALPPIIHFTE